VHKNKCGQRCISLGKLKEDCSSFDIGVSWTAVSFDLETIYAKFLNLWHKVEWKLTFIDERYQIDINVIHELGYFSPFRSDMWSQKLIVVKAFPYIESRLCFIFDLLCLKV